MTGHPLRTIGFVVAAILVVIFGIRFAIAKKFSTGGAAPDAIQKTATSKDGTLIAYEQTGSGPLLILVSAALTDRDGDRPLAKQFASSFTVLNYDRRGRGKSGNKQPYSAEREIEDLQTLISTSAGPVYLFGSSSGAVLALDAANRLNTKLAKVFLYEPPFIVDSSRPPLSKTVLNEVNAALAANQRDKAVSLFFIDGMGIPKPGVLLMRLLMPAWADMVRLAHTAPYDLVILTGTQDGKPLPRTRWSHATMPTLVAVGTKSEPFFHSGAKGLVGLLPDVTYKSLDGLDHSAVLMAPQALATAVRQFFAAN